MVTFDRLSNLLLSIFDLFLDVLRFSRLSFRALAAENLFLPTQLARHAERQVKRRRARTAATLTVPTENIIAIDWPQNRQHPVDLLRGGVAREKTCNVVTSAGSTP